MFAPVLLISHLGAFLLGIVTMSFRNGRTLLTRRPVDQRFNLLIIGSLALLTLTGSGLLWLTEVLLPHHFLKIGVSLVVLGIEGHIVRSTKPSRQLLAASLVGWMTLILASGLRAEGLSSWANLGIVTSFFILGLMSFQIINRKIQPAVR